MRLLYLECKKILLTPALWFFVVACALLNVVTQTGADDYEKYMGAAAGREGVHMDSSYIQRIMGYPYSEYRDYLSDNLQAMGSLYKSFDTSKMGKFFINANEYTPGEQKLIEDKYAILASSVREKAERGEDMDIYATSYTYYLHDRLFGQAMPMLLMECMLVASLVTVLSTGYETTHKTHKLVYSTRRGRRVQLQKLGASMTVSMLTYFALAIAALGTFTARNSYLTQIWHSSVSSQFNFILYGNVTFPFITWRSMTVLQYIIAQVAVSVIIVAVCVLIAFSIGQFISNSYYAFIVIVIVHAVLMLIPVLAAGSGLSILAYVFVHCPVWLWNVQSIWFTEGGGSYLWPHFETVGAIGNITILTGCAVLAYRFTMRKDIL